MYSSRHVLRCVTFVALCSPLFAAVAAENGSISDSSKDATSPDRVQLSEVVVTAEKREERLMDVPVPVTALTPQTLVESNQTKLQDYFSSVPGLNLTPAIQGVQNLTIRGIGFGFANPTTGITVDDVPYGSAAGGLPTGLAPPDLDPDDLARIEVLRGPQGTLYGASSMGGLIRYVTAEPSLDRMSGAVQAGTSFVENGAEPGYNFRGSLNAPLGDTFAIRANAFTRQEAGFIDNIQTGQKGVNQEEVLGGHVSALWRPLQDLSIKLSVLYQDNKGFGQAEVDNLPGLGRLQQSRLRDSGRFERKLQGYSLVVKDKIGAAELTAVSGYSIDHNYTGFDLSAVYGPFVAPIYGTVGIPLITDSDERKLTQEIRLAMPIGTKIDWLLGGFYSNEKVKFGQYAPIEAVDTGAHIADLLRNCSEGSCNVSNLDELAAFTDITYHFTDRFDVQVGGRESKIRQWTTAGLTQYWPPFGDGSISPVLPTSVPTANVFTFLVTPRFKVSEDLMVYARIASGYQPGGGGIVPGGAANNGCIRFNYPCEYKPDKTKNYEIGAKGNLLGRLLSFDTSIYYIDWQDLQLNEYNNMCGCTFLANGGGAKSEGVELSLQSRPATGLTISSWFTYNRAVLTDDLPAGPSLAVGASGAALPFSVKWSGNLSVSQTFPLTDAMSATVGGNVGYLGARPGLFPVEGETATTFPAYTKVDLRAQLAYQSWTAAFSVNNVANKYAQVTGGPGFFPEYSAAVLQPRTLALSLRKTF
ncbi:MAG: TonB-dependent receptor [Proteobacteria bacterium]|nr:TonB-dependent receptor [Pseudomonadota bacterium]